MGFTYRMRHRSIQRCVLWLLPLLVLRAVVPVGFMVSAGADGLSLTLCSGHMNSPVAATSPDPHAGHHMKAGMEDHAAHSMHRTADLNSAHHDGKHLDSPCPFSSATAATTTALFPYGASFAAPTDEPFVRTIVRLQNAALLRGNRIRGPPRLS
jgi:hypothetical protein